MKQRIIEALAGLVLLLIAGVWAWFYSPPQGLDFTGITITIIGIIIVIAGIHIIIKKYES